MMETTVMGCGYIGNLRRSFLTLQSMHVKASGTDLLSKQVINGARWAFLKIRADILRIPIVRILVCWGSMSGSPYFGKLPDVPQ